MPERFEIETEQGQPVSATAYHAKAGAPIAATVVLGHGAGADQRSAFMVTFGTGLSSRGINVVTFNFLYMEQGRSAPDPAPRLESAFRATIDSVKNIPELAGSSLHPRKVPWRPNRFTSVSFRADVCEARGTDFPCLPHASSQSA